jgi:hypothetical protein
MPLARVIKEMRCGNLRGRVEEGVGEDEGRYRLNFRYRGRELRMVFSSDGGLISEELDLPVSPRSREILKALIRKELVRQARLRVPTTYARLAKRIPLSSHKPLETIGKALDALMDDDARENRPLVASLAVETIEPGLPAQHFFRKVSDLGRFSCGARDVEAYAFHAKELQRAIRFYAPASTLELSGELLGRTPDRELHHLSIVG